MVDVSRLHLRFNVSDPQDNAGAVHVQGPFKDRPGSAIFLLLKLPLRIPHPIVHVDPVPPDIILELLALPSLELM
jgi:hypothetical protein